MEFVARLRKQTESLVITIPNEVVQSMVLKEGDIHQFSVKRGD